MKQFSILAIFILISIPILSQEKPSAPDYNSIGQLIFDSNSEFFYPNLLNRYQKGDSTLTQKHFRYLYFGYTFNPRYEPDKESRYREQMMVYLKKGQLSSDELNKFINLCERNLNELPFDIRTLNILSYSYGLKNDTAMRDRTRFKKNAIIDAIISTGDGKTETTAYHIIDKSHEYDLINELGLKFAMDSELQNPKIDYLMVVPNNKNIRGIYFNISRILYVRMKKG